MHQPNTPQKKKLIVIGGGASGFFCAIQAASFNPQLEIRLLEKSSKLLSKVKISAGGRCNVTHACFSIPEMIKNYPRGDKFLKKAFHQFFTTDTIEWFKQKNVLLKTEPDGRMFPVSNNSQTIVDCLLRSAEEHQIQIELNTQVTEIHTRKIDGRTSFEIMTTRNQGYVADFVCVACGGFPKSSHFDWLTQLGHQISPPVPSLFTFNMPGHSISRLMGIVVDPVRVKIMGTKMEQTGPLLITHWGMSGPAVLKLSAWAARELEARNYKFRVQVNWLPAFTEQTLIQKFQEIRYEMAAQKIMNRNPFHLPTRFWEYVLLQCGIDPQIRWADLPAKAQNLLVKWLCTGEFEVNGKTTFKEEFVTSGGIKLDEVEVETMQSKIVKGLYFAGEILDVDAITGGFNFQNAWTTGFIAAKSISGKFDK